MRRNVDRADGNAVEIGGQPKFSSVLASPGVRVLERALALELGTWADL